MYSFPNLPHLLKIQFISHLLLKLTWIGFGFAYYVRSSIGLRESTLVDSVSTVGTDSDN